jgi:NADH-quinone oxidoreductase subunit A
MLSYFCNYNSDLIQTFFLQASSDVNSTLNYLPIGIQLLFAVILLALIISGTHFLGPKRKTADKLVNFESGIESQGNARQPMAIKYFLVAILFVLFDVEVIFFYPYGVNFRELGWHGFLAVMMFVGFFLAGFFYIIKKGALKWEE